MLRNSRLRWLLGLLAVLALLAAACGDDDDSGDGGDSSSDGGGESALPTCLDFEAVYALVGPESTATTWSEATELADAAGSEFGAEFPDLPLTITGPGEESGTFDSFVEIVIEPVAEAQGVPEDNWLPRPDYTSSPNDNVIIEGIQGTEGSFGWVGYAFFQENQDAVRAFEVAGEDGTCVAPNDETIASGEYPIARDLFIYVNAANAESNPALAAFVDYYTGDEGYAATSEAGYVALTEDAWAETGAVWEEAGGAPGEPESGVSGEVVVSGSSTVEPISSLVAESFSGENPDVSISVDGPGTGDGFELFCNGETDISDASRPIEDEEIEACEANGIEFIELKVAIDGLSLLTQA